MASHLDAAGIAAAAAAAAANSVYSVTHQQQQQRAAAAVAAAAAAAAVVGPPQNNGSGAATGMDPHEQLEREPRRYLLDKWNEKFEKLSPAFLLIDIKILRCTFLPDHDPLRFLALSGTEGATL